MFPGLVVESSVHGPPFPFPSKPSVQVAGLPEGGAGPPASLVGRPPVGQNPLNLTWEERVPGVAKPPGRQS